ncbi:unnamed protein product, partial [Rotaria magnacalcarata]
VIVNSDEQDQSSTYNIAKTKARLQNMDKTDREAYCELIKQKHKSYTKSVIVDLGRRKNIENVKEMNVNDEEKDESPTKGTTVEEEERLERKQSVSPPPPADQK